MAFYPTVRVDDLGWGWDGNRSVPPEIGRISSSLFCMKKNYETALRDLSYDQLWRRAGEDTCAIGNILMHTSASEHEWIGYKIGGRTLRRNRPLEFSTRQGPPLPELQDYRRKIDRQSREVLEGLSSQDVRDYRSEQGLSIPFILHYVNHHLALHLGQIIMVREFLEPGFRLYGDV